MNKVINIRERLRDSAAHRPSDEEWAAILAADQTEAIADLSRLRKKDRHHAAGLKVVPRRPAAVIKELGDIAAPSKNGGDYAENFLRALQAGTGPVMILCGPASTGKTTTAYTVRGIAIRDFGIQPDGAPHGPAVTVLQGLYAHMPSEQTAARRALLDPTATRLILLDSLEHLPRNESGRQAFAELVLWARDECVPLIVTTRLDGSGVKRLVGDDTWTVLLEGCTAGAPTILNQQMGPNK